MAGEPGGQVTNTRAACRCVEMASWWLRCPRTIPHLSFGSYRITFFDVVHCCVASNVPPGFFQEIPGPSIWMAVMVSSWMSEDISC